MRIRKLFAPSDLHSLEAHLLRLEQSARHERFHGCSAPDEIILTYISKRLDTGLIGIGAFDGAALVGVCEICPIGNHAAEVAFSVERGYRGRGIAFDLGRRAMTLVRNRGITAVHMTTTTSNLPTRRLAMRLGGRIVQGGISTECQYVVELVPPDCGSMVMDLVDDLFGVAGRVMAARVGIGASSLAPGPCFR